MTAQSVSPLNLLPTDRFEYSKVGRFLKWALTTGRYVVVLTELVVIVAFLSRFWFDRQLTDLRELRVKKSAVVSSFEEDRVKFENVKASLKKVREIINAQYDPAERLELIQSLTPVGVEYQSIEVGSKSAILTGYSPGTTAFSSLLSLLQQEKTLSKVEVKQLKQSGERYPGFDFVFELEMGIAKETEKGEL